MELKDYVNNELKRVDNANIPAKVKQEILNFAIAINNEFEPMKYASVMYRLLSYKPLTPLTGEDDEWKVLNDYEGVSEENKTYQNKRYSAVFKRGKNGKPYDTKGRRLYDTDGNYKGHLKTRIKFPYAVPTEPDNIIVSYKDAITGEEVRND